VRAPRCDRNCSSYAPKNLSKQRRALKPRLRQYLIGSSLHPSMVDRPLGASAFHWPGSRHVLQRCSRAAEESVDALCGILGDTGRRSHSRPTAERPDKKSKRAAPRRAQFLLFQLEGLQRCQCPLAILTLQVQKQRTQSETRRNSDAESSAQEPVSPKLDQIPSYAR
jgi:hypothetical protein